MTTTAPETPTPSTVTVGPKVHTSNKLTIPLTSEYRCLFSTKVADGQARCGAQSLVKIVYATGELFTCGHHYAENIDALHGRALEVFDERGAINDKPSPSANV